jgi:cytochrome c biogenesis protein CcmG, thiol:disulfide interchange protein DsbE
MSSRLLIIFLLFSFCSWSLQPAGATEIPYQSVPNLEQLRDPSAMPEFTLPDVAGRKVSLSDFRGKIVMLNFWASWCAPCREEMPAMERLYREFSDRGFVVLSVNVRDKREDALAFMKELNLTYPVVFDPSGRWLLRYGAWGLPNTYLIGRDREGLARMRGHADWYSPSARALIRALVDGKIK